MSSLVSFSGDFKKSSEVKGSKDGEEIWLKKKIRDNGKLSSNVHVRGIGYYTILYQYVHM